MSVSNNKWFALVFVGLYLLSQINGAILPCDSGSSCCNDNSIVVNGVGRVSVQPDIAYITVGATVTAKTTQAATQGVADKIAQIIQILNNNKVPKSDIKTESINIYPQYDYPNGVQTIVGQTASQTLIATIRKIDKNGGDLGKIIDQLVAVDKIQFNGLRFDKENKNDAQKQARKQAFDDAKSKAADLAALSERNLGKALSIIDSTSEASYQAPVQVQAFAMSKSSGPSTDVPVGDLDVYYYLNVKFGLY